MNPQHQDPPPGGVSSHPRIFEANITEYPTRRLSGIQFPQSTEAVVALVQKSRESGKPLYPISTGRNWGQGSAMPVQDDCILVNFSRMNQILEVNERLRYAVIEPGVTQGQLSHYLVQHHPNLVCPMTGSGTETSIVGNMMERGVSVRGHRYPSLLGMEVVLGNEQIVRTGMWHWEQGNQSGQHIYAPGIGPDLNGLFTQSNLGIVTGMIIRLEKRQQRQIMSLTASEAQLVALTDKLFALREAGVLQDGLLLTGMQDPRTSAGKQLKRGNWFASASLHGTTAMQEAAMLHVRHELEGISQQLRFYDTENMPAHPEPAYLSVVAGMYQGVPSNYALETMARLGGSELEGRLEIDEAMDVLGFVCALPAVPFEGQSVVKVIAAVDAISLKWDLQPYYNFVGLTTTALEGFFRVFFPRGDEKAIFRAHQWNIEVHNRLFGMGMFPYRINIEQMELLYTQGEDTFWQTISQIKSVLDPDHILAPGRYCPPPTAISQPTL